ncbi:MAG: helix-turn-helix transcriptional regulator [candidate division WOR-3 bacterium]|nr:helix-turn-helix transcriptional regulator [candidate division WOR-3 bacterium]
MKSLKDRFDGEKELGKRLRECRLRVGLTQQKLATAMGRQGKGSHYVAGRLERGEVPNPGVGLLADYLRACRASFADIQDVLDRYTAKQTAVEVETSKALAKVREFLPAKIDRPVERFDRGVRRGEQESSQHTVHSIQDRGIGSWLAGSAAGGFVRGHEFVARDAAMSRTGRHCGR